MKLYDLTLSGNCYKVRLFAALAGIPLEIVPVDFLAGEHKRPPLIELNPWGEIPILVDGEVVLRDSQAILVYLARRYADEAWLPGDPAAMAEVVQWLSTAANEVQNGPGAARLVDKFGYDLDKADTLRRAARILPLIDARLADRDWLALDRPTIADCAVLPYVALAPEGGVALDDFPHIRAWIARVKALPGFVPMPGV
ncbi:glutathione S-transferase [Zoogloea oryzae]|uniref:Glutathione S-transferase n=1 Tax=Zoogloea oryzae TaxID=310767 RepID=A0ABQ6F9I7_9RHOO|nr:glutathione S-transferase [Zoogloea oryzae]GLT21581.1 glutathione S-transferase [Zoogloea oryzae]